MAENLTTNERDVVRRRSPLLLIGSIMWVLCLIAICFGWYVWRQRVLAHNSDVSTSEERSRVFADILRKDPADEHSEDDVRSPKTIKLIPQKGGGFVAQEVTKEGQDDPWDADGIEDFSFQDTAGNPIVKQDLIGKPFVIGFIFTHCLGPCPTVTLKMRQLQDQLSDYDFNLVTLTVDPARDTRETLTQYGQDNGANFERWKFLTGEQSDIYGLIQRSFKMPVEEKTGADRTPGFEIIHSVNILLVDATGRVVGKYDARAEDAMGKLRKDLKRIAKKKTNETESASQDGK